VQREPVLELELEPQVQREPVLELELEPQEQLGQELV